MLVLMNTSLWLSAATLTPAHAGDTLSVYDSRRQEDAELVLLTNTSSASSCASQDLDVEWALVQGTPRVRSISLCDDTTCRLLSSREYYFESAHGRVPTADITLKG